MYCIFNLPIVSVNLKAETFSIMVDISKTNIKITSCNPTFYRLSLKC